MPVAMIQQPATISVGRTLEPWSEYNLSNLGGINFQRIEIHI